MDDNPHISIIIVDKLYSGWYYYSYDFYITTYPPPVTAVTENAVGTLSWNAVY